MTAAAQAVQRRKTGKFKTRTFNAGSAMQPIGFCTWAVRSFALTSRSEV
jgi:hypothetical protein